jgi:hypothetical protein
VDFFAIVGGHPEAVYRMELQQDLQNDLTEQFNTHAEQMLDENLVRVPFARENFHPDETEILQISPFDLPELLFDPLENAVGWRTLPLDEDTLSRVYCVFSYEQERERVVFQVIPKAQRLAKTGLNLILAGNSFTQLKSPGLILGNACHAVFQDNVLTFKSVWWLKQIIDISSYYRAATDADVERFSEIGNVKVEDLNSLKQKSGQWVRSRLAYILDSGVLQNFSPTELAIKAAGFNVELKTVNENGAEKLVIPQAHKELRSVLKFLEEEYYEGPITGAAYEANSKRRKDN